MRSILALSCGAFVIIACTGGGGAIGSTSSSSGASSSSGSNSSSGGSSGGASSGGTTTCTEFTMGAAVGPEIGGSFSSQAIAQSVSDYAGAAAEQVADLTAACKNIAVALEASSANQAAADGNTDERAKLDAWCKLAVTRVSTLKAQAGGTVSVTFAPPTCKLSVSEKAACQGRCAGTGPCDTTANPMVCTGGNLSNGFCEGGQLGGGCQVDAKCDASCDASVIAKASCPLPVVAVSFQGASDAGVAAQIEAALEADMPAILSLRVQCDGEAKVAPSLSGNVSAVTDIKAACIPPLVAATSNAVQNVQVCLSSATALAGTIN